MKYEHVLASALVLAIGSSALSCGSPTSEQIDHTMLAQFARPTTDADVATLSSMETSNVRGIRVISGLSFRTSRSPDSFAGLAGIERVDDLGLDEDPEVSVFITVASDPTDEDFEFLNSLPTARVPGFLGGSTIAAVMRLSEVQRLEEWTRFVEVEVAPNTNRIGI